MSKKKGKHHPSIPQQQSSKPASSKVIAAQSAHYSGPLPSAEQMERYHALDPQLVHRIVAMAESEAEHRRQLENKALESDIRLQRRGQTLGFWLSAVALLSSVALAYVGAFVVAALVGGTTVAVILSLFVTGRRLSEKGRQ